MRQTLALLQRPENLVTLPGDAALSVPEEEEHSKVTTTVILLDTLE